MVRENGYTFAVDATDRTREAKGDVYLTAKPKRLRASQSAAGGSDRLSSDDGGHFIAARFGGPTASFNHFAQDANFNRGAYRILEDKWANEVRAGKHVFVDIVAHYPAQSRRPDMVRITSSINGRKQIKVYASAKKGTTR